MQDCDRFCEITVHLGSKQFNARHSYSNYQLFVIDTGQKIGKPKDVPINLAITPDKSGRLPVTWLPVLDFTGYLCRLNKGSSPWIYGVIFTIAAECGATFAEYAPVNEPTSLCAHKSRTLAAI
jgi:hypothetical protein